MVEGGRSHKAAGKISPFLGTVQGQASQCGCLPTEGVRSTSKKTFPASIFPGGPAPATRVKGTQETWDGRGSETPPTPSLGPEAKPELAVGGGLQEGHSLGSKS